jgi:hypothetical protein
MRVCGDENNRAYTQARSGPRKHRGGGRRRLPRARRALEELHPGCNPFEDGAALVSGERRSLAAMWHLPVLEALPEPLLPRSRDRRLRGNGRQLGLEPGIDVTSNTGAKSGLDASGDEIGGTFVAAS